MQFSKYTLICEVWTKSSQVVIPQHALTFISWILLKHKTRLQ